MAGKVGVEDAKGSDSLGGLNVVFIQGVDHLVARDAVKPGQVAGRVASFVHLRNVMEYPLKGMAPSMLPPPPLCFCPGWRRPRRHSWPARRAFWSWREIL